VNEVQRLEGEANQLHQRALDLETQAKAARNAANERLAALKESKYPPPPSPPPQLLCICSLPSSERAFINDFCLGSDSFIGRRTKILRRTKDFV
jgi:hypothetical protein